MFFANARAIPVPSTIEIFNTLPVACSDTFNQGLPVVQTCGDYMDVIILSHAGFQNIGSLDNTSSSCTSSYSKSVTKGFTFSTGQKISSQFEFDLDAIIATAKVSVGIEIPFNEEWSNSATETVNFEVPGGKQAFLYQGYTAANILRMNCKTAQFAYVDSARMLTSALITSGTPIIGDVKLEHKRTMLRANVNGEKPLWLKMNDIASGL